METKVQLKMLKTQTDLIIGLCQSLQYHRCAEIVLSLCLGGRNRILQRFRFFLIFKELRKD